MTASILVAGSANLDFVVRVPRVPAAGETVLGSDLQTYAGGKGANQAVACARAGGAATRMLLALGDDAYAEPIETSLRAAGVQATIVRVADRATGSAFISVSDAGENAITVAPGANACLRDGDLPALDGVTHLLMQLETPIGVVEAWATAAHAADVRVILNAAPAHALGTALLGALDVLVVNENELAAIAGAHGSIADQLASIDVACVIVTLGARGICARVDGRSVLQVAFAVEAIDTTGAGDTFCGAFVAADAQGLDLPRALRFAAAAAALATTRPGAQSGIPTRSEVEAFLQASATPDEAALAALAAYCGIEPLPEKAFGSG